MADRVKVMIHLWVLLVKLNNLTFGFKDVLFSESTILDGRPAGLPGEAGNTTTSAPSLDDAWAWAEFGNKTYHV